MAEVLEALMVICFGISWPLNIRKSYLAGTAKGKSLSFVILMFSGYVFVILSNIIMLGAHQKVSVWVLAVYVLNAVMVFIDFVLYFRNKKLDRMNGIGS